MTDERIQRERNFWNDARSTGEPSRAAIAKYYSVAGRRIRAYEQRLLEFAQAGAQMLEVGCSNGANSLFLADHGAKVVGIDISDVAVARARRDAHRKRVENVEFFVGDATALGFADHSFDVVFGSSIVHHLDVSRFAKECARVTRPSGSAVFLEPLGTNPLFAFYRRLTPAARTPDERPLNFEAIVSLGREWESREVAYYDFTTLALIPLRNTPAFSRALSVAHAADDLIFTRRQGWRLAWFVLLTFMTPCRTAG